MKKLKTMAIIARVLLCGLLLANCRSGGGGEEIIVSAAPIPQSLVGVWSPVSDKSTKEFEISSSGRFFWNSNPYVISVSDNIITITTEDDVLIGTFDYSINTKEELVVKLGLGIGEAIKELSPFIKSVAKPLEWVWEVLDDSNQSKWAPGISTLEGYVEHTVENGFAETKYSQAYVLESVYDSNNPKTGWYKKVEGSRPQRVEMEDAIGYDTTKLWPASRRDKTGPKIPRKVPKLEKVIGPDGKTEVEAFHFKGTMMQKGSEGASGWVERTGVSNPTTSPLTASSPQTDYRRGCGWPAITLYATPPDPDEDPEQKTRLALMDGYGYTFWVKPMKEYRTYRTSVENWDFRPNEGHEPGFWYGTQPGRDAVPGATGNYIKAPVGKWTKVKVIYDPKHRDYHMDVNQWIYMYNIQSNYPGDEEPTKIKDKFNKDHSIRIAWAFQLQHNGGNEGTTQIEYSVSTGRHDYDVYIYGLEILQY